MVFVCILIARANTHPGLECGCAYRGTFWKGGCVIDEPAGEGFTCRCKKVTPWGCQGDGIGCEEDEILDGDCPANCYSLKCCRTSRGNCRGYEGHY